MATVIVTWNTSEVKVPATTDLTRYLVSIDGVGQNNVAFGDPLSSQFDNVAPGEYIARVSLANNDNSHTDFEKSMPFSVPENTVILDAPDVIEVQVS